MAIQEVQQPIDRAQENAEWNTAKIERHVDNLAHLEGFYHGTYYHDGVPQLPKRATLFTKQKKGATLVSGV